MNVLLTSRSFIPSVLLCGNAQMEYLQSEGKLKYRFVKTTALTNSAINWADIIIFVRAFSDYELQCMKAANVAGKATVYVLDDNLPEIPDTISSADLYTEKAKGNIKEMISECTAFLTPSRNLLKLYGNGKPKAELIEEPSLGIKEKRKSNTIKIGFAGTVDRSGDVNSILKTTIENLLKEFGSEIQIEFFGAKPDFVDEFRLKHIPYTRSYEDYCKKMGDLDWDIGLAPMQPTYFSRFKHYNKLIEYSGYGIAGVYSCCEPYTFAINNRENGLLCANNTEEWTKAIRELIINKELRDHITETCQREAKEKYSLKVCSNNYFDLLSELKFEENAKIKNIRVEHLTYIIGYMYSVLKKYRFGIIKELINRH